MSNQSNVELVGSSKNKNKNKNQQQIYKIIVSINYIWQVILSTEPKAPQFTCFCMGETLL